MTGHVDRFGSLTAAEVEGSSFGQRVGSIHHLFQLVGHHTIPGREADRVHQPVRDAHQAPARGGKASVSRRQVQTMPATMAMTKMASVIVRRIGPISPAPIAEPSGPQSTVAAALSHAMSPSAKAKHPKVQRFSDGDIWEMSNRRWRVDTWKRPKLTP